MQTEVTRRTAYAICLQLPGSDRPQYAGRRLHTWTDDPKDAIPFESMTAAGIAAIEVFDLAPQDYTVVAI